jgi:hypothetical protein
MCLPNEQAENKVSQHISEWKSDTASEDCNFVPRHGAEWNRVVHFSDI